MEYRRLGNTGLKVSRLSYGTWVTAENPESQQVQTELVKKAFDSGVNYFDTAEEYGYGIAEKVLGNALKALNSPREDLVISTKLYWSKSERFPRVNDVGLSRKHIVEGMKASLARLQLEYVDVVFCHRPDHETPMGEVCCSMSSLIDKGYTFYWGTSMWPACYISAAIEICERLHLHKPCVEQPEYSILVRDTLEKEYSPLFERYDYGTTIWSPLASGVLTGKYNDGKAPEGSRLANDEYKNILEKYKKLGGDKIFDNLKKLGELAKEHGMTQTQLSILWTLANRDVTTCILGASRVEQLEEALGALKHLDTWDKTLEEKVEGIFQNAPEPEMNFKTWQPRQSRRCCHVEECTAKKACGTGDKKEEGKKTEEKKEDKKD